MVVHVLGVRREQIASLGCVRHHVNLHTPVLFQNALRLEFACLIAFIDECEQLRALRGVRRQRHSVCDLANQQPIERRGVQHSAHNVAKLLCARDLASDCVQIVQRRATSRLSDSSDQCFEAKEARAHARNEQAVVVADVEQTPNERLQKQLNHAPQADGERARTGSWTTWRLQNTSPFSLLKPYTLPAPAFDIAYELTNTSC